MRKFNFDTLTKIIILIGFSLFYLKIIISREILLYVHPRIIPFVVLAVIFMIVSSLILIGGCFKTSNTKFKFKKYAAFIIPLVMITLFQLSTVHSMPASSDTASNFTVNSVQTPSSADSKTGNESMSSSNADYNTAVNDNSSNSNIPQSELYGGKTESYGNSEISHNNLDITDNLIKINAKNFVSSLDEIIADSDKYEGMEIEITGFIYCDKNLHLNDNQFIIARYMMVCCAADMQIAGLRCQYDINNNSYDEGTWVKLKGKIKSDTFNGTSDPLILIDEIEMDSDPDTSYVYPY